MMSKWVKAYKYVVVVWWILMWMFSFFVNAWDMCNVENVDNVACKEVKGITSNEPYCVDWYNNPLLYRCKSPALANSLSLWDVSQDSTVASAIKQYCDTMLSPNQYDWWVYFSYKLWDDTNSRNIETTFDSRNSLFVYALCSSFKSWSEYPFVSNPYAISGAFKWDIAKILRLNQMWYGDSYSNQNGSSSPVDLCSLEDRGKTLNECDIPLYSSEIFSSIMSELFKIMYAQSLHVNSTEWFSSKTDKQERVREFLKWYFKMDYDYSDLKSLYPDTIKTISSNQQTFKNMLWSLKLLNNSAFNEYVTETLDEYGTSCSSIDANERNWFAFVACALHQSQWNSSALNQMSLTLIYNEILNYSIFVAYYKNWINKKIDTIKNDPNNEVMLNNMQTWYADLSTNSEVLIEAANQTLNDLEDVILTYPIHIWLLMYQEQLKTFRNNYLSPIVTKFYSLSEKLQNVQILKG